MSRHNCTMHLCGAGGELVARVFKEHGVKFVFTLVGGHISPVLVGAKNLGIRVVDVRHEATAVFAADAVARLSGVPGVAVVTAGPGITNTITAVKNAQMAESPLILIGGAAATVLKGRGALQDIEQLAVLKPICKWVVTIERVRDIVPIMRKAFQIAASGVPGPVFVELPIDLLYNVFEIEANMALLDRKRVRDAAADPAVLANMMLPEDAAKAGLTREAYIKSKGRDDAPIFLRKDPAKLAKAMPWPVQAYLRYRLRDLFAGGFETLSQPATAFAPLPVSVPAASSSQVAAVAKLLRGASKPVMIVASQAMLFNGYAPDAASAPDRLAAAVKSLGIPTFLSGMARGLLGRNCPLHIRQNRKQALAQADVVILAGAVCDFRLDYGRALSRRSKIIAVNRGRDALAQNSDMFWKAHMAVQADPATFLLALASAVGAENGAKFASWASELKEAETKKEAANSAKAADPAFGHGALQGKRLLNPLHVCEQIEAVLPDNAILVGDGGDFVATASYIVRPRGPLGYVPSWPPEQFGSTCFWCVFFLAIDDARCSSRTA